MQSISMFLDIAKFAGFRWTNTDVSKIQGVRHVIYISLESSLGKEYKCAKFHHFRICVTDFREGEAFLLPPYPQAAPKKPILNRIKIPSFANWDMKIVKGVAVPTMVEKSGTISDELGNNLKEIEISLVVPCLQKAFFLGTILLILTGVLGISEIR